MLSSIELTSFFVLSTTSQISLLSESCALPWMDIVKVINDQVDVDTVGFGRKIVHDLPEPCRTG